MKLDFSDMDVGTFQFNFARALMVASTGGADVGECLKAAAIIKDNDEEGWVREWANLAEKAAQEAERSMRSGQAIDARLAYLRASNYYRAAMIYLPPSDVRLDRYIELSRETFHRAAELFSPRVEAIEIPFEGARLPGYFLSAGQSKMPTLIVINGGDSHNEEMVHWIGFAAVERGWNCLIFEGPGQWSALQMNPGLYLRADYEVPVKAVIEHMSGRIDVDTGKIAVIGYSLSSQYAPRVAAFDDRICAAITFGGPVVDVNEAWFAVLPSVIRKSPPGVFDHIFNSLEKASPQFRGFVNHFMWSTGVTKPHELVDALKPLNIKGLAPKIKCPMLVIVGEGEYAQTDEKTILSTMHFISEISGPVSIHEFEYKDGWAASHCSVGDEGPANAVIFDWLDRVVLKKAVTIKTDPRHDWNLLLKYKHNSEIEGILQSIDIEHT
jgi:pimeloyl-ACP methyl ester carboxylesterase